MRLQVLAAGDLPKGISALRRYFTDGNWKTVAAGLLPA